MADTQIKITADTRQAERAIDSLNSSIESIQTVSSQAGRALAAITAAAGAMGLAVASALNRVGDLNDLGKALGITAQNLDYLQQSAKLAGIGADEFNSSLMRMRGNIGEALVQGAGAAFDATEKLGLNLQELSQLPADQQITKITDALSGVENPATRSALAIDLLGRQGPKILEAAKQMAEMKKQAQELGYELSDLDVAAISAAGDAVDQLGFMFKGLLNIIAAELSPYLVAIVDYIKESVKEAGGFGNVIRTKVIPAIKAAVDATIIFASIWLTGALLGSIASIVTSLLAVYKAIKLATAAGTLLNQVMSKNPILKIAAGVAALGAAYVAVEGVSELFADLDKRAQDIMTGLEAELKKAEAAGKGAADAGNELNKTQEKAAKALQSNIKSLETQVQFERDRVNLGEAAANASKMIADEEGKLKEAKLSMSDLDKQRIRNAYAALEAIKQSENLTKAIQALEDERLKIGIDDVALREVAVAIRGKEREFNRQLTDSEKERLTTAIQITQALRATSAINDELSKVQAEASRLLITDLNLRGQQAAIDEARLKYGSALTAEMENQVRATARLRQENEITARLQQSMGGMNAQSGGQAAMTAAGRIGEFFPVERALADYQTLINGIQELRNRDLINAEQKEIAENRIRQDYALRNAQAIFQVNNQVLLSRTQLFNLEMQQIRQLSDMQFQAANQELIQKTNLFNIEMQQIKQLGDMQFQVDNQELMRATQLYEMKVAREQQLINMRRASMEEQLRMDGWSANQAKQIAQERTNFEMKSTMERTQFAIEQSASIMNSLGASNRKAFEAAKAFNIANAVMNTYMGATKALATYPPPFNFIAAAAVVAAGLAQVASIRSQQYSGRQLGGPVMGNQSYIVGENGPELFTPATTGRITRNQDLGGGGNVNVNFYIQANDTTGFDELLTQRRGLITQIIRDAQLERGVRGAL